MTLYEFKCLDEMEQAEAVWNGVHLANREDDEHRILLYQIDGFYVEVFYDKEHNVIRRFRSFSNVGPLEPYLEQIDLAPVFNK